jgi:hypothetical protein
MKKGEKERANEEQKKVTIKIWDEQGVEEYRRRLEKEQNVEKMAVELKEVIEKATIKRRWRKQKGQERKMSGGTRNVNKWRRKSKGVKRMEEEED